MIIRVIRVYVKQESVEAFMEASRKNHESSLREPGVLRFDVLQSAEHPEEFLLYEVYDSVEAVQAHKETSHYHAWKDSVENMMERPRESVSYTPVAPVSRKEWK